MTQHVCLHAVSCGMSAIVCDVRGACMCGVHRLPDVYRAITILRASCILNVLGVLRVLSVL